ncbi:hypothetical protein BH10PSE11_BH10PSE11_38600 [soil metagenome]
MPNTIANPSLFRRLRAPRGIAIVLMMAVYLLASALHSACDLDVTNPTGNDIVTLATAKNVDGVGKGLAIEHHCHGCFSVSLPATALSAVAIEHKSIRPVQPRSLGAGLIPGIDTPPPRFLT